MIIILDPFFILLIILISILLSAIQANPCSLISNLNLLFPEVANTEFLLLNSYPGVTLTSFEMLSSGLKVTKSFAFLLFDFGD